MTREEFLEGIHFLEKCFAYKIPEGALDFWRKKLEPENGELFLDACGNYITSNRIFPTLEAIQSGIARSRQVRAEAEIEKQRKEEERYRHKSLSEIFSGQNVPPKVKRIWTIAQRNGTRREYLEALKAAGGWNKKKQIHSEGGFIDLEEFYEQRGLDLDKPMGEGI